MTHIPIKTSSQNNTTTNSNTALIQPSPYKLIYKLYCVKDFFCYRQTFTEISIFKNFLASIKYIFSPKKTILYYPECPERGMIDYRLTILLGFAITNKLTHRYDVAFKRKDTTFFDQTELQKIKDKKNNIINSNSIDISKRNVGKKFEQVFGYALDVEPTEYQGMIVDKSDQNAAHDGVVVEGPMKLEEIREGRVYQKAIDNTWNKKGYVLDLRVPIHGDKIPLIYLKYRKQQQRFSNVNDSVTLATPEDVFSAEELQNIIQLAKKMGIDFGEFDVLRDKDKRIYVVDINNTPFGPPNGLSKLDKKKAMQLMAKSFKLLLNRVKSD